MTATQRDTLERFAGDGLPLNRAIKAALKRIDDDRRTIHDLRNRVGQLEAQAHLAAMAARAYPEPMEGQR